MAAPLGTPPPDQEVKPVGQRIVRIALILTGLVCVYVFFGDMIRTVFSTARSSRVTGDFKTIAEAIDRYDLEKGKPFLDSDIDKLQGATLSNVPRDPDGRPYIYDWFYHKIVYAGPDGVLQTLVPGQPAPAEGETDDEVYSLKAMDRLVYGSPEGGVTHLFVASSDGSNPKALTDVDGDVVSIGGLPAKESNLIALGVKKGNTERIDVLLVGEENAKAQTVTSGANLDGWPTMYDPKTEWMFYQGTPTSGKTAGTHDIFKMSYKDKMPVKLTSGGGDWVEPAVDLKGKWIWCAARKGANYALHRFRLTTYNQPECPIAKAGVDLRAPSPSPSGDFVAYVVPSGSGARIEVLDFKTKKQVFSKDGIWPKTRIVWSPDDQKIGYFSMVAGAPKVTLTHVLKNVTVTLPALPTKAFTWLHD